MSAGAVEETVVFVIIIVLLLARCSLETEVMRGEDAGATVVVASDVAGW